MPARFFKLEVIKSKSREYITAKIDWLQIVFNCSIEEVVEAVLRIDLSCFLVENGRVKHKSYDICYTYGSIKIFTEETPKTGNVECYLVLSGDGCTIYERLLQALDMRWADFFQRLFRFYDGLFQVKRLDIALDDRNEKPYFTVKQLITKCEKKMFYSKNRKHDIYESSFIGTMKSRTLYIGKRKSDLMFRIYDKDMETAKQKKKAVEEIGSWKRLELELKRDMAHVMAQMIAYEGTSLEELVRGIVKEELTFYTDDTCKNIWRPWERYLGNMAPIHIPRTYEVTGLLNTEQWLIFGGGMAGIKAFQFLAQNNALGHLQNLGEVVSEVEFSRPLAKKMADHLTDIGRTDLIEEVYEMTKKENLEKKSNETPLLSST
ncbi:replication initiation protein [Carnobacterium divergens]|uniref:replication initiation factor domain-containing protein n=1 Tax=Carnobacterium divergens TaxID=2748 RepID=UPI000D4DC4F7|nr:replication initiation factor domain-containing protein [Carnobacterium divergens]MCO6016913.1 replication initiation factor domain-containing protein [Carnobacterium divergens]TFI62548.1 replication initiation protein [Carnobacterium divergens]TFI89750.1 replication initiation protein [Carnobacterium divergens]TFJ04805.1 replication initiation protein [Carnobacterium divergens]TFJ06295.1 replication initiation protein [Carnobacterium divergens]